MHTQQTEQPRELILLDRAQSALCEANTVDELSDLRNKAQAIRAYVRKAQLGRDILLDAATIKLRAERRLGEMLQSLPLANSAPGNQYAKNSETKEDGTIRLQDLGISKSESSKLQKVARLSAGEFEEYIQQQRKAEQEPTLAGCLRLVKPEKKHNKVPAAAATSTERSENIVQNLQELTHRGKQFATIYADPPWPDSNQATCAATNNQYPTLSVDDICDEPVAGLCQENAHLHLWTTNSFLLEGLDVLEAWGFTYKSCFIWVKPTIGPGTYWRVSHEILLLGIKGTVPFADHSVRSWQEFKRTRHREKPKMVRELIEQVSPGPYLELYSRHKPVNEMWTVYGNQIS